MRFREGDIVRRCKKHREYMTEDYVTERNWSEDLTVVGHSLLGNVIVVAKDGYCNNISESNLRLVRRGV